ncbi:MAG: exodeoxyribonuclease VII large subunit [Candidatus Rokubacteria bacterium]|nr:exodeoxyribonuclease VII large subunit [Candidatus Rokubacteria bacterium]
MAQQLALDPGRRVYSVSELTAAITETLEARFGGLWVEGEISNLRVVSSGHVYFTLKDEGAQVRAVLFKSRARRLRFAPADGLHVLAFANLDVYAARGEYQLVCEVLEPKGLGALQLAFEQLKARLAAEGLFDPARKRPLPVLPRRVGLVTSPTGAAVRDFLRVITRRFADVHVLVYPVRVQGETAAPEIARALHDLNRMGGLDVLVVARGGGSLEDLWAFNEEAVARAIAGSKIPVISAVGHETDVTIADFVADLRAPTPSAAAELVVREKAQLVTHLAGLRDRLHRTMAQRVGRLRERLDDVRRRRVLTDPARPLRDWSRRLDDLGVRLQRGLNIRREQVRERLARAGRALRPEGLRAHVRHDARHLAQLGGRLTRAARGETTRRRRAVEALAGRLDGLSPLACLARGYSICTLPSGEVVTRAGQAGPGTAVSVRLREGTLGCRVEEARDGGA